MKSKYEAAFDKLLAMNKIEFVEQFAIPPRKFRYDFAIPSAKLLIEINGGIWMKKSGHNTAKGLIRDRDKAEYAKANGWEVITLFPHEIKRKGRLLNEGINKVMKRINEMNVR